MDSAVTAISVVTRVLCFVEGNLLLSFFFSFVYTSVTSLFLPDRESRKGSISSFPLLLPATYTQHCASTRVKFSHSGGPLCRPSCGLHNPAHGVIMLSSSVGCGQVQKYRRLFSQPLFFFSLISPLLLDMWVFLGVHPFPRFPRLMVNVMFNNRARRATRLTC